jgi:hypothetical protein
MAAPLDRQVAAHPGEGDGVRSSTPTRTTISAPRSTSRPSPC